MKLCLFFQIFKFRLNSIFTNSQLLSLPLSFFNFVRILLSKVHNPPKTDFTSSFHREAFTQWFSRDAETSLNCRISSFFLLPFLFPFFSLFTFSFLLFPLFLSASLILIVSRNFSSQAIIKRFEALCTYRKQSASELFSNRCRRSVLVFVRLRLPSIRLRFRFDDENDNRKRARYLFPILSHIAQRPLFLIVNYKDRSVVRFINCWLNVSQYRIDWTVRSTTSNSFTYF